MLEKRISLVEELNYAARSVYAKEQLTKFVTKFSDLMPEVGNRLQKLNGVAECETLLGQLDDLCDTFDKGNNGQEVSLRFSELRTELEATTKNIREYKLSSAQNT